jgi:dipeptide/tripeptide permease
MKGEKSMNYKIITQNKPLQFGIGLGILVISLIAEAIVVRILGMDWYSIRFAVIRVIRDFGGIMLLLLIFDNRKKYFSDKKVSNEQKELLQKVHRFITVITILFCILDSIRNEIVTPNSIYLGTGIIIVGASLQFANYYLRTNESKEKKAIISILLVLIIGVFLFGPLYEWLELLFL